MQKTPCAAARLGNGKASATNLGYNDPLAVGESYNAVSPPSALPSASAEYHGRARWECAQTGGKWQVTNAAANRAAQGSANA